MVVPDGTVALRHFDETDATGPIAHIVDFFGPPPPFLTEAESAAGRGLAPDAL